MNCKMLLSLFAACALGACTTSEPSGQDRFALADANKDDKLSRKEASDAVVRAVFAEYDLNRDGKLTFAEWKENDDTADEKLFSARDSNRDGHLTLAESQASADRQNVFGEIFQKGDTDGDGLLSRDEAAALESGKETRVP
jgi:Ca2+-binding EF-hand superfamily protein